jgi:hypothetical protein
MSPQSKEEYTVKRRISAIPTIEAVVVQSVGGMSDGDREHFPLQLRPNHWSPCKCSTFEEGFSSIRWRGLACPTSRCTDEGDSLR